MRTVRYSALANAQLREIFDFIAIDDNEAAKRVLIRLRSVIDALGQFATGRASQVSPGAFVKVVPRLRYIVTYELDETDAAIVILTVRHTSRDFPR